VSEVTLAEGEHDLELLVVSMHAETDDVVSLSLRLPDGGELPAWEPGAHVDLMLDGGLVRQYSLDGSPADRTTWRVSVLREPDGRGGSAAVHETVRPGDVVGVRGPRNHFALAPADAYLFVAGGIGITPILPMIATVDAAGIPWRLVYGGRSRSSMAFTTELAAYGAAVTLVPQDELGLLDLDELLGRPVPGTAVYCCGPEPLLLAVEERCATWPAGSLHVERFRPREVGPVDDLSRFEVVCELSGVTVQVPPDRSIMECAEAAGVSVPSSCREGTCGTCETPVLEGLPEHRDSVLSAEEREYNDVMMICVGRSLTPRLVLEL
jgi:ferredoxin-NADP reductase